MSWTCRPPWPRVRVLGSGSSNKNDRNDARSVAVAALRAPGLRSVAPADHAKILRLVAKRNVDIGKHRTQGGLPAARRLNELFAGGISKELNASDAQRLFDGIVPTTPVERIRRELALELLGGVRVLDAQLTSRTVASATRVTISITPGRLTRGVPRRAGRGSRTLPLSSSLE